MHHMGWRCRVQVLDTHARRVDRPQLQRWPQRATLSTRPRNSAERTAARPTAHARAQACKPPRLLGRLAPGPAHPVRSVESRVQATGERSGAGRPPRPNRPPARHADAMRWMGRAPGYGPAASTARNRDGGGGGRARPHRRRLASCARQALSHYMPAHLPNLVTGAHTSANSRGP